MVIIWVAIQLTTPLFLFIERVVPPLAVEVGGIATNWLATIPSAEVFLFYASEIVGAAVSMMPGEFPVIARMVALMFNDDIRRRVAEARADGSDAYSLFSATIRAFSSGNHSRRRPEPVNTSNRRAGS